MGYWLNIDVARVILHDDTCDYPKTFGRKPKKNGKWKWFATKEEAGRYTSRFVMEGGCCLWVHQETDGVPRRDA